MSLAKVVSVSRARKDQGKCGKCGKALPAGEPYAHFAVGFRGRKQVRCSDPACYPRPSERESSLVADVYAAQESAEETLADAGSLEGIKEALKAVSEACDEVSSSYEQNPTFDGNDDLQERVDTLNSASQEFADWEPEKDEPTEEDEESWTDLGDSFEEAYEIWLSDTKEDAKSIINETELP